MKNYKWCLLLFCCFFLMNLLSAQQRGLLLIHRKNTNRKLTINANKYLAIQHNGQTTEGFLYSKTADRILLLPEKGKQVPLFDLTKAHSLFTYEVPIQQIQYLTTKKEKYGKFYVGGILTGIGGALLVTGLRAKKARPDLASGWVSLGGIGVGVGLSLFLLNHNKKYYINQDAWAIN